MSKFWKIALGVLAGIALLALVLFLITYFSPTINQYAKSLADSNDWPIWLAGIAAPILFLYKKFTGFVKGLFPGGSVSEENERIKAERDRLRKDVDALLDWRNESLKREFTEITRLQNDVAALKSRVGLADKQIEATTEAAPVTFTAGKSDHEVSEEYMQSLRNRGIAVDD